MTPKNARRDEKGTVIVMMLGGGSETLVTALDRIAAAHPGAELVLLTHMEAQTPPNVAPAAHWRDGAMRGPLRFLALSRRLSWLGAICGYDLAPTLRSRVLRSTIRPSIPWYEAEKDLRAVS